MVKDGARFYDPLGLVSEGVKVDFQTEVNSYLYGTRFMSYLAETRSPEDVVRWGARGDGSKAYYASQFQHVFGTSLEKAWQDWIEWEKGFQQKNLDAIRQYPVDAVHGPLDAGRSARCRAPTTTRSAGCSTPASTTPASCPTSARSRRTTGAVHRLTDIKGPRIYTVTSLAFDPGTGSALLHGRQQRLPRPRGARPGDRENAGCCSATRASARSSSTRPRPLAVGRAPPQRHRDARAHPGAVRRLHIGLLVALRRRRLRPRRLARRHAPLGVGRRRSSGQAVAAGHEGRVAGRGRRDAGGHVRLRDARSPRTSSSPPTARRSTAAPTTPASRTSSATTSRPGSSTR